MKLNYKKTIFVGFAFFLICAFWQAYDTIIPKILTDKFGMNQTSSGFIMALDNILALFMLPLFGTISDHCTNRHGRRTVFIVVGTVAAALLLIFLSVADNAQLKSISSPVTGEPLSQAELYDQDLEIITPAGERLRIREKFTKEEFSAIDLNGEDGKANPDYADYVVPARQAYSARCTAQRRVPLTFFVVILLLILISMATFRSPAVALMPDVTPKPLRSKANAVINLMGTIGGALVLVLSKVFGTDSAAKALMSYTGFFACISVLMLVSLVIFIWKVREPQLVQEMREESARYGIPEEEPEPKLSRKEKREARKNAPKLSREERQSLLLILCSVVLWFMGYNAVTSKYSVYAGSVLGLGYALPLLLANVSAIISYIPVGLIASRVGRKKTIMAGVVILGVSFFVASFLKAGVSIVVTYILFALCGIGWATINVNSYPMVVELASGGDVGKYTGFYYTASMAAQTMTPIFSGWLMDRLGMRVLFPYAAAFVLLALLTMYFVKHGDNRPEAPQSKLEALDVDM